MLVNPGFLAPSTNPVKKSSTNRRFSCGSQLALTEVNSNQKGGGGTANFRKAMAALRSAVPWMPWIFLGHDSAERIFVADMMPTVIVIFGITNIILYLILYNKYIYIYITYYIILV